ncbi:MAG TPA: DUF4157 domain-containing protein [Kofleriaceae bacterium]
MQRRVAASGGAAVALPRDAVQLRASALAVQLFSDAVGAGVHPAERVQSAAAHGLSGSGSTLPHLAAIQQSFGRHDVSAIQAHVGGRAAEGAAAMGAEGFAAGNAVAFAGSPDLHLAAHEAAHVVQQRAGVQLKGGVGEVGDAYERHADAVADLVVQGKSAESLLDQMAPSGAAAGGGGVQRFVVQRREIVEHDPAHIRDRLEGLLDHASSSEQSHIVAALRAVAHGDARNLMFWIGDDHYQLDIAHDTAVQIVDAYQHVQAEARAHPEHQHARTRPSGFTRVLGRVIGVCAGDEGTFGSATVELELPAEPGETAIIGFSVTTSHEEDGIHVSAAIELGAGVGIASIAELRAVAGLHAQAVGTTGERAAENLVIGLRAAAHELAPDLTGWLFDGSELRRDAHTLAPGESADASVSASLGVRLGDDHSAQLEATAGVSEHEHVRGAEGGAVETTATMWDFTGSLTLPFGGDNGVKAEMEAHFPSEPGEPTELALKLEGEIQFSEAGYVAVHLIALLQQMIAHFSEAGANPNRATATTQAQHMLTSLRQLGDAPAHALFAEGLHESPVGFELELGMTNHGGGEIVVRQTTRMRSPELPEAPGVRVHAEVRTGHVVYREDLATGSATPAPAGMCSSDAQMCE